MNEGKDVLGFATDDNESKGASTQFSMKISRQFLVINGFQNNLRSELFYLNNTQILDEQADEIAKQIANNEVVKTLSFSNLKISDRGMAAIAKMLAKNHGIISFSFINSNISIEKARLISEALQSNKTIKILDFANSGIVSSCVEFLVQGLRQNKSVEQLLLHDNPFGDKGAEHLAKLLKKNSHIKEMNVSNCGITDVGALPIFKLLNNNSCYFDLDDKRVIGIKDLLKVHCGNRMHSIYFLKENSQIILNTKNPDTARLLKLVELKTLNEFQKSIIDKEDEIFVEVNFLKSVVSKFHKIDELLKFKLDTTSKEEFVLFLNERAQHCFNLYNTYVCNGTLCTY